MPGVVVTERDPYDGRRVLVSIAPGIRTRLFRSRARRPVEPALRSRYPDSSEAEIARVVALLTELADILASERAAARQPRRRIAVRVKARQRNVPAGTAELSFQADSKSCPVPGGAPGAPHLPRPEGRPSGRDQDPLAVTYLMTCRFM